jgi:RNA ligase (TIGR02306 family)
MSEFKVSAQKIQLLEHQNAERLYVAKIGTYSLVVGKDSGYKDDDIVIFAPKRSILPDEIKCNYTNADTGLSYLSGPEQNRVKSIKLRGEPSEGVTLSIEWALSKLGLNSIEEIPLDTDLSEQLGITEYQIPIPIHMAGEVEPIRRITFVRHHDVEQFRLYSNEFQEGEEVIATEKLHGSLITGLKQADYIDIEGNHQFGKWLISSKGISKRDLSITESPENTYWQAFHNTDLDTFFSVGAPGDEIQFFGEMIPCQKNFSYGQTKPTFKIFRLIINGKELEWDEMKAWPDKPGQNSMTHGLLRPYLVPELYSGPFDESILRTLADGCEKISGKNLHIKEGIVIRPKLNRRSKEGFNLFLKILNKAYKESDEAFS